MQWNKSEKKKKNFYFINLVNQIRLKKKKKQMFDVLNESGPAEKFLKFFLKDENLILNGKVEKFII